MSGADPQPDPNVTQSDIDAALAAGGVAPAAQDSATPQVEPSMASAGAGEPSAQTPDVIAATVESPSIAPIDLPDFNTPVARSVDSPIDLLSDVELNVKIELGRTEMLIEDVLRLGEGSVVELDKLAGDPVDVLVNDKLVARGEILVLNDNFCVRISEIIPHGAEAIPA